MKITLIRFKVPLIIRLVNQKKNWSILFFKKFQFLLKIIWFLSIILNNFNKMTRGGTLAYAIFIKIVLNFK